MLRRSFLGATVGGVVGLLAPDLVLGEREVAALPTRLAETKAIVYSIGRQRVWLLEPGFVLAKTHLVSGRRGNPPFGHYHVYSKSPSTFSTHNPAVVWNYMVRFYLTPRGANIGFHQIPQRCNDAGACAPLQTEDELGTPRSSGCVRQRPSDAKFLYNWAPIGTLVVVV